MKKHAQMPCDGDERQYVMPSSRRVVVNHLGISISISISISNCIGVSVGVGVGVEHRALCVVHRALSIELSAEYPDSRSEQRSTSSAAFCVLRSAFCF